MKQKSKDAFTRFCESVGLDEQAFAEENRRINSEIKPLSEIPVLSSPDLPELLEGFSKIPPEKVWQWMFGSMPEMMKRIDVMLIAGMTPEWISMRPPITELPIEIQTGLINALHWRQSDLRQKLAQKIFMR